MKKLSTCMLVGLVLALLILFAALARSANADVRHGTYELRADGPLHRATRERSCRATRLLREKLCLTYDETGARTPGVQWDVLDDFEGGLVLGKGRHPNKTLYSLAVWQVDDRRVVGELVLFGFLATYDGDPYWPHGRPCEDRVRLVGKRVR